MSAPSPSVAAVDPGPEAEAATPHLATLPFVDPERGGSFRLARVAATSPRPLPVREADRLDGVVPGDGRERDLRAWTTETWTTALVVLDLDAGREPTVVHSFYAGTEHPEGPVDAGSLLLGASMTKSALAHLVGVAVRAGSLALDDRVVDHVGELAGTGWEPCTVEHVATMTTGTSWAEDHRDPHGPAVALTSAFDATREGPSSRELLRTVAPAHEPGTRWVYSTADSQVLDWVRERATGQTYVEALTDLWGALGATADAVVATDAEGVALAGGGLAATASDWVRVAALQHDGTWFGERLLDAEWVDRSSAPAHSWTAPGRLPSDVTSHAGFGRHWWPLDTTGRLVTADGSRGQFGFVDRDRGIAVLKTSAWPYADAWADRASRDLSYLGLPLVAQAADRLRPSPYGSPPGPTAGA